MLMRLTLSALLCAALFSGPALAHDHHGGPMMPPPGMDMPPSPPGYDEPGYDAPVDPRWERMHGEWMARCHDREDRRDGGYDDGPAGHDGCDYPGPGGPYGHPGAYMGYGVPMVMVPVLRSKPCPEVVEEWVEEVVPVRHRSIPPRARVIRDKRVPLHDKRVPVAPSKRIPY
jgi:hypothetical protein